jgi:hypothetical protein
MPTTIREPRRGSGVPANTSADSRPPATDPYFGVVSSLIALGTAIAVPLAAAAPNTTDIMWLFSQVP